MTGILNGFFFSRPIIWGINDLFVALNKTYFRMLFKWQYFARNDQSRKKKLRTSKNRKIFILPMTFYMDILLLTACFILNLVNLRIYHWHCIILYFKMLITLYCQHLISTKFMGLCVHDFCLFLSSFHFKKERKVF